MSNRDSNMYKKFSNGYGISISPVKLIGEDKDGISQYLCNIPKNKYEDNNTPVTRIHKSENELYENGNNGYKDKLLQQNLKDISRDNIPYNNYPISVYPKGVNARHIYKSARYASKLEKRYDRTLSRTNILNVLCNDCVQDFNKIYRSGSTVLKCPLYFES